MSWKPEHKQATRERIVAAAASEFRKHGFESVGVAEVMAKAGLTHGGFYAHFRSKEDLIGAALEHALQQSPMNRFSPAAEEGRPAAGLLEVAGAYLNASHVRHPERGCPLAALGDEWARLEGPARASMEQTIVRRRDGLARRAPGPDAATRRAQAAGTLAAMVGGIVLARGLGGGDAAERFLADVKRFLAAAMPADPSAATGQDRPTAS